MEDYNPLNDVDFHVENQNEYQLAQARRRWRLQLAVGMHLARHVHLENQNEYQLAQARRRWRLQLAVGIQLAGHAHLENQNEYQLAQARRRWRLQLAVGIQLAGHAHLENQNEYQLAQARRRWMRQLVCLRHLFLHDTHMASIQNPPQIAPPEEEEMIYFEQIPFEEWAEDI
ncbi:hypothetical protein CRE_26078 [Caenorhabditis remanei]|uniref:Uncharacterized protein n=1 Tax=Caenorhabditis remanei TaxID=31234 RepID=E3LRL2_CAERE|nr:hypothetical protein CRE_26078 [Caenorhabditis remanei]